MARQMTSASIITPPGEGGIGIIAVLGPDAAEVVDGVFVGTRRNARSLPLGSIAHGAIVRDGQRIDEVIVARLTPPSGGAETPYYEVNCHGGIVAVRTVLRCLQEAGARAAPWQDWAVPPPGAAPLSASSIQARALARLPHVPSRLGAAMLLHQADGALYRVLESITELLVAGKGTEAASALEALLATASLGHALLAPPRTALLGPANVGKSTLLNALLEEERAIVHHEPGTTRDVVSETACLRGVPFELMDCAGIRAAQDDLEASAISRSAELAADCDIALLVFDIRERPERSFQALPPVREGARVILVGNKLDLLPAPPAGLPPERFASCPVVYVSARSRAGLDRLESALIEPFESAIGPCSAGGPAVFDAEALDALLAVRSQLTADGPGAALAGLRRLIGQSPP
jgi:tRNA modification GTPase